MADKLFSWLNLPNLLKDVSSGADTKYARAVVPVDATGAIIGASGTPTNAVVTQPTASNLNAQVVGNTASASADTGNPVKVGGVYNSASPTFTTGQRGDLQLSANGYLISTGSGTSTSGADAQSNNYNTLVGYASNAIQVLYVNTRGQIYNGATWDRTRKPNIVARIASSAASGNPAFLKSSAGDVMTFWGVSAAAIVYLQIYNKASAPVIGTDTPVMTYPIPASTYFSQTIPNGGYYLSTGIAYAFTTDAAGTTGSAAAAILSFALMGA